jgi:uncharacterized protein (TIGR03083 family)
MTIDHLSVLRSECAGVGDLARTVPHETPIAPVPGWTVHDVIAHLAGDFLWVLGTLATRVPPRVGLVAVETRGTALCDEWDAVSARLVDRLGGIDPLEPCPNFAQGDRGVLGFHPRHQALETTIHRWDVESAVGEHAPIDPEVATDGIAELFEVYTRRYSPHQLSGPLTLACSDTASGWLIAPSERDGFVEIGPWAGGDADVEAPADDLLLLLWQRIDPDDPRVRYRVDPATVRPFLVGPLTA